MEKNLEKEIEYLSKKVKQHEETIAQLVLMVAETNQKLMNVRPYIKETH